VIDGEMSLRNSLIIGNNRARQLRQMTGYSTAYARENGDSSVVTL
jgi:hypothetical protein